MKELVGEMTLPCKWILIYINVSHLTKNKMNETK